MRQWLAVAVALAVAATASLRAAGPESGIISAARAGDVASVRALVKGRADVNTTEADGTTALHWAARIGDGVMAALFVQGGARVDAANRYGVTPLSLAARHGYPEIVGLLLDAGASVKAAESGLPEGQTLAMHAARAGDVTSLRRVVIAGSNPNARETRTGTTAAVWAAVANRPLAIRALAEAGADLNATSKVTTYPHTQNGVLLPGLEPGVSYVGQTVLPRGGWSPLMFAAREGAIDAATALLDAGVDRNAVDPEGTSALVIAIINANFDLARRLIERGADVNLADVKGMTPLYAAVDMHTLGDTFGRPSPPRHVLDESVGLAKFLLARGANPNARLTGPTIKRVYDAGDGRLGDGSTPFMRAARKSDVALMRMLVEAGADARLVQKNGTTALMLAAGSATPANTDDAVRITEEQALEGIRVLLAAGADVNAQAANGDTVLHAAATTGGGLAKVIALLLDSGAAKDVRNKAGRTPFEAAQRTREPNAAALALLATTADPAAVPPTSGPSSQRQ
jgi:ankyrin repeat protein